MYSYTQKNVFWFVVQKKNSVTQKLQRKTEMLIKTATSHYFSITHLMKLENDKKFIFNRLSKQF